MANDLNESFKKAEDTTVPVAETPATRSLPWEGQEPDEDELDDDGSGPGYESAYTPDSLKYDGVK